MSGQTTTYKFTGDPVHGTGWLDGTPADERIFLSSGPVNLSPGQSQEVSYAIVIGQGPNRLASIQSLRCDDDAIQAFFDRAFALPLPGEFACGEVANCPRPADDWYQQCAPGGGDFTPAQIAEIARRVDVASMFFDWGVDPLGHLAALLDPAAATLPRSRAMREFAAFLCNVAATDPPILPATGRPAYLFATTPIACPGLAAWDVGALAGPARTGLTDASYVDVGPHPPGLLPDPGIGAPFWIIPGSDPPSGAADYAINNRGSALDPADATQFSSVEIRFTGGPAGQKAYRYLRCDCSPRTYLYQDYVDVPFTVWDIDQNRQLNVGFLENYASANGVWDPDPIPEPFDSSPADDRQFVQVYASTYSATPDPLYTTTYPDWVDCTNLDLMYYLWPNGSTAPLTIDNGDIFRFKLGLIPGSGVDGMMVQLASLAPDDPAAIQTYNDIAACLSDISGGIGIGATCDVATATLISLVGTDATPDRVTVTWHAGGSPASRVQVERREGQGPLG